MTHTISDDTKDKNIFFKLGNHLYNNNNNNYLINNEIFEKNKKTYDEYKQNYIDKLNNQNKFLDNLKKELTIKINELTLKNKNISDEIKFEQNKFNNKSFFNNLFNKDNILQKVNDNNTYYNLNFETITELYEEIINIDEYIKKNNYYMTLYN